MAQGFLLVIFTFFNSKLRKRGLVGWHQLLRLYSSELLPLLLLLLLLPLILLRLVMCGRAALTGACMQLL